MAIRKMKPITNGTRHMSRLVNDELDKVRPEKSLTVPLKSAYDRDNYGHRMCLPSSRKAADTLLSSK